MAGFEVRAALKRLNERVAALENRIKVMEDDQEDVVSRCQMYANQAMALVGQAHAILGEIKNLQGETDA